MILRSLGYQWTDEDRSTRARWLCGLAIIYGCIALLFTVIALSRPSVFASNGPTDRAVKPTAATTTPALGTSRQAR